MSNGDWLMVGLLFAYAAIASTYAWEMNWVTTIGLWVIVLLVLVIMVLLMVVRL